MEKETIVIISIIALLFLVIGYYSFTGYVTLDTGSKNNYLIDEQLGGEIKITIEEGNKIPDNAQIILTLNQDGVEEDSATLTINEFLPDELEPVEINTTIEVNCTNVTINETIQEVCENVTTNSTEEVCENQTINETIQEVCENQTIETIELVCTNETVNITEEVCATQTVSGLYFNQPGTYSREITDFIDYTFTKEGDYDLIFSIPELNITKEMNLNIRDEDEEEEEDFSVTISEEPEPESEEEIGETFSTEEESLFTGNGDGTPMNPYQITNCEQLEQMRYDLNANYILMNDIDCSGREGFMKIGTENYPFNGIFEKGEYSITGLTIDGESVTNENDIFISTGAAVTDVGGEEPTETVGDTSADAGETTPNYKMWVSVSLILVVLVGLILLLSFYRDKLLDIFDDISDKIKRNFTSE